MIEFIEMAVNEIFLHICHFYEVQRIEDGCIVSQSNWALGVGINRALGLQL